jgi:hypothetical protein
MPDRTEALLAEYGEVTGNFRLLTDIRFKLLAILPIAAAATAALRDDGAADGATATATLGLSAFGLLVTAALATYNERNDQLYDELVGRAAEIERTLGVPDGAFAHRPANWLSLGLPGGRRWSVDHRTAIGLIYASTVALWLFLGLSSVVQLLYGGEEPAWWAVGAVLVAVVAATLGVAGRVRSRRRGRRAQMRAAAVAAVAMADDLGAADAPRLLVLCAGLRDNGVAATPAFAAALAGGDVQAALAAASGSVRDAVERVRARTRFYARDDPEVRRHFGLEDEPARPSRAARLVALLTDLPARWLDDVASGRR